MKTLKQARELQQEIVELRRTLHAHPELSYREIQTSRLAADKLTDLGFEVRTGIAKTGVIADKGTGSPTIAIRADMDALPLTEENDLPFKSQTEGVMHACGHDAHVSCALAAAKILAQDTLPGRLRMIMQPAEEQCDEQGLSGARRLVEEGAMKGVDAVIGLHISTSLPSGSVAIQSGPVLAAADAFKVVIRGRGGHAGYPENTIDAIVLATQVIQAFQQIVSRRIAAVEPAVITVGSIRSSSTRGNMISESVELEGTIRTTSEATRKVAIEEVKRACTIAQAMGGSFEIDYQPGYPATINDARIAAVMHAAAVDLIDADKVLTVKPKMAAEDFSFLSQVAPGAYMFLGVAIEGDARSHHSPRFDFDESNLYVGTAILAETARRLMMD